MAVTMMPNWLAGFVAQARLSTDITNVTANRITAGHMRTYSPTDPRGWKLPTSGLVFRSIGGIGKRSFQAPIRWQQMQVEIYGADDRLADELYRIVWPYFCPQDMTAPHGFVQRSIGVAVLSIDELGSPFIDYEEETGWPRMIATWLVSYSEQPVNITFANASIGSTTGM